MILHSIKSFVFFKRTDYALSEYIYFYSKIQLLLKLTDLNLSFRASNKKLKVKAKIS